MSIREWDIPYEELKIQDKIGSGRFSTVHMGNWHGDVAIKFLDMENNDDESTLEAFKLDVATFRYSFFLQGGRGRRHLTVNQLWAST